MMIDKKNELELIDGHAFDRYLVEVWNQRITYPNKEKYAFYDDVKDLLDIKNIIQILFQPLHL